MRTSVILEEIGTKIAKGSGREYHSCKTSEGVMNCFEGKIVLELMKNLGKSVDIEIEEASGFKNIRKFYGVPEIQDVKNESPSPTTGAPTNRETTMYTSYAKDVFITLREAEMFVALTNKELMESAIALVRQAREAFK